MLKLNFWSVKLFGSGGFHGPYPMTDPWVDCL